MLPNSTIRVLTEDPEPDIDGGWFLRFHVCLGSIKKAFVENCRKIMGLDGCHLRGPYVGNF